MNSLVLAEMERRPTGTAKQISPGFVSWEPRPRLCLSIVHGHWQLGQLGV